MKLFRVTIQYTSAGERMENVVYVESSLTAQQVCADFASNWVVSMAACQSTNTTYTGVKAIEISHIVLDPEYYEQALATVGSGVSALSDPQLAVNVGLHTGLSGRKRRGRFFIGGVPDTYVENGRLTAAGQADIGTRITTIKAHLVDGSPNPKLVVFSKKIYSGLLDIILDSYKPVTAFSINFVLSTMRSRKPA